MGTKSVVVTLLDQYLKQLNLEVAGGRAAIAQQLHNLAEDRWDNHYKNDLHTPTLKAKPTPAERAVDSWTAAGRRGA